MSEEDKPLELQRGELISKHLAAKERSQGLHSEYEKMLADINRVLTALAGKTTAEFKRGQFSVADVPGGVVRQDATWPTPEAVASLIKFRQETEKEIIVLESQLRKFGLGEYLRR